MISGMQGYGCCMSVTIHHLETSMRVVTYTAPSYWASYLINGDSSGIEMSEVRAADRWIEEVGLGDPVGCEECGFMRWHDARMHAAAADCCEYVFYMPE